MLVIESIEKPGILFLPQFRRVRRNSGVIAVVRADHLNLIQLERAAAGLCVRCTREQRLAKKKASRHGQNLSQIAIHCEGLSFSRCASLLAFRTKQPTGSWRIGVSMFCKRRARVPALRKWKRCFHCKMPASGSGREFSFSKPTGSSEARKKPRWWAPTAPVNPL